MTMLLGLLNVGLVAFLMLRERHLNRVRRALVQAAGLADEEIRRKYALLCERHEALLAIAKRMEDQANRAEGELREAVARVRSESEAVLAHLRAASKGGGGR